MSDSIEAISRIGRPRKSSSEPQTSLRRRGRRSIVAIGAALCLKLTVVCPLKAQELDWAIPLGATAGGITTDGVGNSYVTGTFSGTVVFGAGEVNETTMTSAGGGDLFVSKYDPNGALVWARRAGGISLDQGSGIATDSSGSVYVTGGYSNTAIFGADEPNQTVLGTPLGDKGTFVAKYMPDGTLAWAKRNLNSERFMESVGIATDSAGNSYVTGVFLGTATFGPGDARSTTLTSFDFSGFVARYDSSGALAWAVQRANGTIFGAIGEAPIATDGPEIAM